MNSYIETFPKVEFLGLFGFSWKEKVGKEMLTTLKGTIYEDTIKDFWGGGSWINTSLIANLHKVYESILKTGKESPTFDGHVPDDNATEISHLIEDKTRVPYQVVIEFLRSLFYLASTGVIEYKIYDPVGYREVKDATSEGPIKDVLNEAGKKINLILLVGGAVAGIYILNKLRS